jgi:hypothetical protein
VSHHLDMSHTVQDFTFGDLTHKLQEEFAHIKFHEFEGECAVCLFFLLLWHKKFLFF